MDFNVSAVLDVIRKDWLDFDGFLGKPNYVVGISGGVDSSCVASLAVDIFGKDRVIGVSLPCRGQSDMWAVDKLFEHLGIRRVNVDIGDAFNMLVNGIENNKLEPTAQCLTNMPARIRMTTLYGVAQCVGGIVLNTCNRSESVVGNDTLFGDDCGSYAPIQALTKGEVVQLAKYLGVPDELAEKTPVDGLQSKTDEERLGVSYAEIDAAIRGTLPDGDVKDRIFDMYRRNRFKLEMIRIQGPKFPFLTDEFEKLAAIRKTAS